MSGSEGRFPKSLIEFQGRFASEIACADYLFERRWPGGFVCPGCGDGRAWLLKTKACTYECAGCGRQTSVTAGTIMHVSKLSLTKCVSGVGKMLVAGAVEVDGGRRRRARLKVIEGFGKDEIHTFVLSAVPSNTRLVTDDWPSCNDIPDIKHNAITLGPMAAHIVLPWTHRLFSNLKRWGLGVYHGLRKTNLQHYLDEFVFRFNRRRTRHATFDTLLGIGARTAPAPYHVLIRKTA
jgi:hypothetical protein